MKEKLTKIKGIYFIIGATVCAIIAIGTGIFCAVKGFY